MEQFHMIRNISMEFCANKFANKHTEREREIYQEILTQDLFMHFLLFASKFFFLFCVFFFEWMNEIFEELKEDLQILKHLNNGRTKRMHIQGKKRRIERNCPLWVWLVNNYFIFWFQNVGTFNACKWFDEMLNVISVRELCFFYIFCPGVSGLFLSYCLFTYIL